MKKNKLIFIIIVQIFIILTVVRVINFNNLGGWSKWGYINSTSKDYTAKLNNLAKNKNGIAICTALNDQEYHYSISDGSGGAYIVWEDFRFGGAGEVYIQRVDSWGKPMWTSNGIIITTGGGDARNPHLCSDGAGGAIITWNDDRLGSQNIYAQRINSSGATLWTYGGVLICGAALTQEDPVSCTDGTNGAIIAWKDYRDGNWDIYARRINSTGTPLWTPNGTIICNETDLQVSIQMISNDGGGAIITWHDARLGTSEKDIYAQLINNGGITQWTSNGTVICNATDNQVSPHLCGDGSGGAIIAWQDFRGGVSAAWDVYAQRITSGGVTSWIGNGTAICTASGSQYISDIITDEANGAIMLWQDTRGSDRDIYSQKINSTGDVQWTIDGNLICSAANSQGYAKICSDGMGDYILVWADERLTPDGDIYMQKIDSNGLAKWKANGIAVCTASDYQGSPRVCRNGAGGAIISWEDYRKTDEYDIYVHTTKNLFYKSNLLLALLPILLIEYLETSQTSLILTLLILYLILITSSGIIVIVLLKKK